MTSRSMRCRAQRLSSGDGGWAHAVASRARSTTGPRVTGHRGQPGERPVSTPADRMLEGMRGGVLGDGAPPAGSSRGTTTASGLSRVRPGTRRRPGARTRRGRPAVRGSRCRSGVAQSPAQSAPRPSWPSTGAGSHPLRAAYARTSWQRPSLRRPTRQPPPRGLPGRAGGDGLAGRDGARLDALMRGSPVGHQAGEDARAHAVTSNRVGADTSASMRVQFSTASASTTAWLDPNSAPAQLHRGIDLGTDAGEW